MIKLENFLCRCSLFLVGEVIGNVLFHNELLTPKEIIIALIATSIFSLWEKSSTKNP